MLARAVFMVGLVASTSALTGCSSYDQKLVDHVAIGEHGRARAHVLDNMTENEKDRDYLLDRMRLVLASMSDGVDEGTETTMLQVYEILRTQGINEDKTVATVFTSDRARFWKGEPFEQALALSYISLWFAHAGEWGNARAAADTSLFQLKDFGTSDDGQPVEADDILAKSEDDDYLETGYTAVASDYALGYLLSGLASRQLGEMDEANRSFRKAVRINSALVPVVSTLMGDDYNTILTVDYGPGPEKYGRGMDNAIADFRPRFASDPNPLVITLNGAEQTFPIACDTNAMAADHKWKGVEDIRVAKSYIGTGLMAAGAGTAAYGVGSDSSGAAIAGLAMMLAGAAMKASAHADCDYCEIFPQRIYLVPLNVTEPDTTVEVAIEGHPGSRMVFTSLDPPTRGRLNVEHVRLLNPKPGPDGTIQAPAWTVSGRVYYANDAVTSVPGAELPYIFGGRCCRTPTERSLADYRAHGQLPDLTVDDLIRYYRAEGIMIAGVDPGIPGVHILEGGKWLYTPDAGTAGFCRLYGQEHAPYQPQSEDVRAYVAQMTTNVASVSNQETPDE